MPPSNGRPTPDVFALLAKAALHDLNNLLHVTGGMAALVERTAWPGSSEHESAREIFRASTEAAELLVRLQGLDRVACELDLVAVLDELVTRTAPYRPGWFAFELDAVQDVPPVRAGRGRLEHAVLGLALLAHGSLAGDGAVALRVEKRAPFASIVFEARGPSVPERDVSGTALDEIRRLVEPDGCVVRTELADGGALLALYVPLADGY